MKAKQSKQSKGRQRKAEEERRDQTKKTERGQQNRGGRVRNQRSHWSATPKRNKTRPALRQVGMLLSPVRSRIESGWKEDARGKPNAVGSANSKVFGMNTRTAAGECKDCHNLKKNTLYLCGHKTHRHTTQPTRACQTLHNTKSSHEL